MNNIKSFNEYSGYELEQVVYDNELNEKKLLRGFFNKRAARMVKSELAEEIEMSKTIMDGIKSGLDSLNENFEVIKKDIEDGSEEVKGDKQKILDELMKILEESRKNTWDLNELIDEGEIDYTGFTANVGIASVAYFGILLTPFRAIVMMHKGYNYFFGIVKNTIRKALVMLQLNFDQFENLIITKGFQSADYLQDQDTSVKVSEFYGKLYSKLFDDKTGSMTGKKGSEYAKQQMKFAKDQIDAMMKAEKSRKLSDNAYNCLDQYNNTYTRSLETLRNYSQEDVQKYLDGIKTSMSKLAGQDVDLQTYSELIIAAAEEHAYKVSSSIYNKFAKMTEVFSLPNQKKLIDLIQAATKEQMDKAAAEKDKINTENLKKEADDREEEGKKIFTSNAEIKNVELGELKDGKYDKSEIRQAGSWTYDAFEKLSDDDQNKLESWLSQHKEVLEECDKSLQLLIGAPQNDYVQEYADSLIDYIGPCLIPIEEVKEAYILNFDEYINESKKHKKKKLKKHKEVSSPSTEEIETDYELSETDKEEIDNKFEDITKNFEDLLKLIFGVDAKDLGDVEVTDEMKAKLNYVISRCDEDDDKDVLSKLVTVKKSIEKNYDFYINFKNLDDSQIDDLKELYKDRELAEIGLKIVGKRILKDGTFTKNSMHIVDCINKCFDKGKVGVSLTTYILLANAIKDLKNSRSHGYFDYEEQSKKSEE